MPAPTTRWLPAKPPFSVAFRFSVTRACTPTAIAFCPWNVAVPTPIAKFESRSMRDRRHRGGGRDPSRAIESVCWICCCICVSWLLTVFSDCVNWFDTAFNWFTFTASVPCVPAATLTTWRADSADPTATTFERPPSLLPVPIAVELLPDAVGTPKAVEPLPDASALLPTAVLFEPMPPPRPTRR